MWFLSEPPVDPLRVRVAVHRHMGLHVAFRHIGDGEDALGRPRNRVLAPLDAGDGGARLLARLEASHQHLTTQRTFYVAISRARDRAELVTDDAARLSQHLEKATGERITALDAVKKYVTMDVVIGDEKHQEHAAGRDRRAQEAAHGRDVAREDSPSRDPEREPERKVEREAPSESVERTDDRHEPAHRQDDPVRKGEREPEPSRTPERDPAHQTAKDPKEKKPELDFELELEL